MKLEELERLLNKSWSRETCSPGLRNNWNEDNLSLGQCAITALIVNDYFGGKIMRCMASSGSHYYNLIDDKIVDLTVSQFLGEIPLYEKGEERSREYLLGNEDTKSRYLLLRERLLNMIAYEKNGLKVCLDETKKNSFMSKEVSKEFRDLLRTCSRQFYVNKKGKVLQRKKN